jgi:ariadne-1
MNSYDGETDTEEFPTPSKSERYFYSYHDMIELESLRNGIINEIQRFTCLSVEEVTILLLKNNWDGGYIMDNYYDDPEKFLKEAGLIYANTSVQIEQSCQICLENATSLTLVRLFCGHQFCQSCLTDYLRDKTSSTALFTECPSRDCQMIISESELRGLIPRLDVDKLIEVNFLNKNKLFKKCPNVICGTIITIKDNYYRYHEIKCVKCDKIFCFNCLKVHTPVSCSLLDKWEIHIKNTFNKSTIDNDNARLEKLKTCVKQCPRCTMIIEKIGGCSHLTCNSCKLEFCWKCLTQWSGGHICSINEDVTNFTDYQLIQPDVVAHSEKAFEFYYTRYMSYDLSHDWVVNVLNRLESDITYIINIRYVFNNQLQFLRDGLSVLINGYKIAKYSYIFAFYLEDGYKKVAFEELQRQLEINLEFLNDLIESNLLRDKNLSEEKYNDIVEVNRIGIINLSAEVTRKIFELTEMVEE